MCVGGQGTGCAWQLAATRKGERPPPPATAVTPWQQLTVRSCAWHRCPQCRCRLPGRRGGRYSSLSWRLPLCRRCHRRYRRRGRRRCAAGARAAAASPQTRFRARAPHTGAQPSTTRRYLATAPRSLVLTATASRLGARACRVALVYIPNFKRFCIPCRGLCSQRLDSLAQLVAREIPALKVACSSHVRVLSFFAR